MSSLLPIIDLGSLGMAPARSHPPRRLLSAWCGLVGGKRESGNKVTRSWEIMLFCHGAGKMGIWWGRGYSHSSPDKSRHPRKYDIISNRFITYLETLHG